MKELKVFFASSINEFRNERSYIGDHTRRLNDMLVRQDLWLHREMCEDESNAVALQGKQNEYNDLIRGSDLFFMIIGRRVGEYTRQEYDVALENHRSTGKPEICVFFKEGIPESEMQDSVSEFKNITEKDKDDINILSFAGVDEICSVLDKKTAEFFDIEGSVESLNELPPKTELKDVNIVIDIDKKDLEHENYELGSYIDTLNGQFKLNGIYFRLLFRDDLPFSEEAIDEKLTSSDLFYLVFSRTVEDKAVKDFEVALDRFKESDKNPRIYTYFQDLPNNVTATESVRKFMDRLDKEIGHYYSLFSHIDSIKLNMILELAKSQNLKDMVTVNNGEVSLDGKSMLSLENVPIYDMNEELHKRKDVLGKLKFRQIELKVTLGFEPGNRELSDELIRVNKEINENEESLHDMEMTILDMFSRVADYNSSGKPITVRQKLASRYLDEGNYKKALAALDDKEIDEDVRRLDEFEESVAEQYALHIREYSDKINILKTNGVYSDNKPEIYELYKKALLF